MKEQFYQELLQLAPNPESARFLLAVSGGRDSVSLAHLFATCNLNFDIAHCNFHLRGEESNKEMEFVKNLPFLNHQKVFVKEFDIFKRKKNSGKSIEMIARELRYQWFDEIGKDYDYIVTAHHANDNAETVLLNMIRGCGLRGVCGIPHVNGKIIRPLLRFASDMIENYSHHNKLIFCIDASNLEDEFLRNKIRHHIIPELEKINPNLMDTFSKNSAVFLKQSQFLDTHIQQYREQLCETDADRIIIDIDKLTKIKHLSLVLFEILHPMGFNADTTENILNAIHSTPGKQFLSDTHILIKDRNRFVIEKRGKIKEESILIKNIEELEKYDFIVEKCCFNSNFIPEKNPNIIYVDAHKIQFPLHIRGWRKGDYFYPFGMKKKKKLSDFFTDMKIDIIEKQNIRLLCSQDQIVWVIGYRADERFRIEENVILAYAIRKKE